MSFRNRAAFVAALGTLACASGARAQSGPCSNAAINQAFESVLHRAPHGSSQTGECNPNNYGGGSWSGQIDLQKRVGAASYCPDPWIGQIYFYVYNRYPTPAECNVALYGQGHWSSYMDLTAKVQAYQQSLKAKPSPMPINSAAVPLQHAAALAIYHVDAKGNLLNANNQLVAAAGHYLISAAIVAQGGGNIILNGGGNIVAQGGGNVVAQGGGNLLPQPGMIVSTNGSNFIVPK